MASASPVIGVLMMAYGGPGSLDDVEPYLLDVRGGRPTAPEVVAEVRERYRAIGGRSPILERTRAQALALEAALNGGPDGSVAGAFRVSVGMRHWHPFIHETLREMEAGGIQRAVGLVMAPHFSRMSIGEYYRRVEESGAPVEVARIERWHLLPGYIEALAGRVRAALMRFTESERGDVPIIFTAHSLPRRIVEWEDPYPEELRQTVEAVMERIGPHPHEFAYQSAGMTREPWLGPDAGEVIDRLAAGGRRAVLIAPVGFVTEHVEILYDVDQVYKEEARAAGIRLERIEMLNDHPAMIAGLAALVRETAVNAGWL